MDEVKRTLNEHGEGGFYLFVNEEKSGEMVVRHHEDKLTVYHTEVEEELEGQGYAKKMLDAMTTYARDKQLQVIPLCEYVYDQFKRHPDNYRDIWNGEKPRN